MFSSKKQPEEIYIIKEAYPVHINGNTEYVDIRSDGTFILPNGNIAQISSKEFNNLMKEYKSSAKREQKKGFSRFKRDNNEEEYNDYQQDNTSQSMGYENYAQDNGYTSQSVGYENYSQQEQKYEVVSAEHYGDEAYSGVILGQASVNMGNGESNVTVNVCADGTIILPDGRRVGLEEASFRDCVNAININNKSQQAGYEEKPPKTQKAHEEPVQYDKRGRPKKQKAPKEPRQRIGFKRKEQQTEQNYIPESEEAKNIKKKKMFAIGVYVAVVAGVLFLASYMLKMQEREVSVIRLKQDVLAGEVMTEEMIEEWSILERQFDSYDSGTIEDSNGEKVTQKNLMLTWDERDEIIGKFASNYTQAGQYLKRNSVTDTHVVRNPWLSEIEPGQEVYTLPFSTDGVNIRMLVPGMPMRVRAIAELDIEKISASSEEDMAAIEDAITENNGLTLPLPKGRGFSVH